jgi:hypothetical protein
MSLHQQEQAAHLLRLQVPEGLGGEAQPLVALDVLVRRMGRASDGLGEGEAGALARVAGRRPRA